MARSPLSFQSFLSLALTKKHYLWDIYAKSKKEKVYRFSAIFRTILRCYIKRLIDSHRRGKFHSCASLKENIIFQGKKFNHIKLATPPVRLNGDAADLARRDFKALADLISEIKKSCALPQFPKEIEEFKLLLENSTGKETLILQHCALWKPKRRIQYVASIYQVMEADREEFEDINQLLHSQIGLQDHIEGNFWELFQNDQVLSYCSSQMKASGEFVYGEQAKFKNTYGGLLGVMHKVYKHCSMDGMNNLYCISDLEWKFFCYFPFFTFELWNVWKEEELYPRIT